LLVCPLFFFFYSYDDLRDLHSFPTRRSSDLNARCKTENPCVFSNPSPLCKSGIYVSWRAACRFAPSKKISLRFFPAGCASRSSRDRKSTRLNSSHVAISYAVFCLKKKKPPQI